MEVKYVSSAVVMTPTEAAGDHSIDAPNVRTSIPPSTRVEGRAIARNRVVRRDLTRTNRPTP